MAYISSKDDYILRSLSKIKHKKYEHFVINRLFHRLNDPDIEFVCQQRVRRPTGNALTDLFFPQFDLHLEVDEPHHDCSGNQMRDAMRKQDIIDATKHRVEKISVYETDDEPSASIKPLWKLCEEIDDFVEMLRQLKIEQGADFSAWDIEKKFSPEQHISNGQISTSSEAVFRYQKDAMACFGYTGGHYQRAMWPVSATKKIHIWFPRLWKTNRWDNHLSEDGIKITEFNLEKIGDHGPAPEDLSSKRIVFPKWEDPLGRRIYRFAGVFEYDKETSTASRRIYMRISQKVSLTNP